MDTKRIILYTLLGIICFALWTSWQRDYGSKEVAVVKTTAPAIAPKPVQVATKVPERRIVMVKTNVLNIGIDTLGGNIIRANLPKYSASLKTPNIPVKILNDNPEKLYVAQSGILGINNNKNIPYKVVVNNNNMVKLSWRNKNGLVINKIFTFKPNSYDFNVNYEIKNNSKTLWGGHTYTQIQRRKPEGKSGFFGLHDYTGAAISSAKIPYEKVSYKDMDNNNISKNITGGWLAMQQRYFLSSWVPEKDKKHHYYSTVNGDLYTIGLTTPVSVSPGQTAATNYKFYVGPEIAKNLDKIAPNLSRTIDYGFLWILSIAIFWIMQHIYNFIGNWGWSIVLTTLLIKAVFYKFTESSFRSMGKMRELAPKMKALKERYGSDKQKMSQAMMEMYKKEKINPLGGCLPMLIQFPFFIALYYVLIEAVQLRHAPFIFWIHDLSVKDPYYILPILMGISMFLTQRLSPQSPDPSMQKMMMFMPIIFTVLFASFPAGLVLYWLVNNLLQFFQQWYIMKKYATKK